MHVSVVRPATRQAAGVRPRRLYGALIYLASDLALLASAGWLGGQLWWLVNSGVDPGIHYAFWPVLLVFPLAYLRAGLYGNGGLSPAAEFRHIFNVTTMVYLVGLLMMFLMKDLGAQSRGIFLTSWALSLAFVPAGRAVMRELFASRTWWGTPVVILGAGKTAAMLIERLKAQPGIGMKPLACFDDDPAKQGKVSGVPVLGPLTSAAAWAKEHGVSQAIVAMPGVSRETILTVVNNHMGTIPKIILLSEFFGMVGLRISKQELGDMTGLQVQRNLLIPINRRLKRVMDLLVGVPLSLVALPIVLIAALAVMAVSPGSPFYAQAREGKRGRVVHVLKLRTMYPDAEARLEQLLASDPEASETWERFCKVRKDPRILPFVGEFLRKTSLDELPQLYNVLKGEMSLVGPRPFPYYHLEQFDEEFRALRREVLPGITGLWQVSARSDGDLKVQEGLDSYYIRDWSLWLDLYLLVRTPWAVVFGKGAY